jgi:signal transduction histidine kinase/GAF domain-containing protein
MRMKSIGSLLVFQELLTRDYQDARAFLTQVLLRTKKLIGFDFAFVALTEVIDGDRYVVIRDKDKRLIGARVGEWDRLHAQFKVGTKALQPEERSFTGLVAATKRPRRSNNVNKEIFYQESNRNIRSEIAVPILLENEELLGVINLESKVPRFYTLDALRQLMLIARLIAPKLFSLVSRDQVADRPSPLPIIDSIITEIAKLPAGTLPEEGTALSVIARTIARSLHSRSCTIWLLNGEKDSLILQGAYGPHRRFVRKHKYQRREPQAFIWKVIDDGVPFRFGPNFRRPRNIAQFDRAVYGKALDSPFMISPILSRGTALGVIKVGMKRRTRINPHGTYRAFDEELLSLIQNQLGSVLREKRSEEERRSRISDGARKASGFAEIFSNPTLDVALPDIADRISKSCRGNSCSIFMWSDVSKSFVLRASTGLHPMLIGVASYRRGEGLTGWVGETGRSLCLDNRSAELLCKIHPRLRWRDKFPEGNPKVEESSPFLAVPIFQEQNVIGIIRIGDRLSPGVFDEADEQLLSIVANYISAIATYQSRHQERLDLLDTLDSLFSQLKKFLSTSTFGSSAEQFRGALLEEAAHAAASVLHADILTLYAFNNITGDFEIPPALKGDLYYPGLMAKGVQRSEVPWIVMQKGTTFWSDVRAVAELVGKPTVRLEDTPKSRFAVRERIVSAAGILLRVGLHPVGVLFVNFRTHQEFDIEKRKIIAMFAAQVALFMELGSAHWRATESVARKTAEELSLDLHDSVLQILNSVVVARAGTASEYLTAGQTRKAVRELNLVQKAGYFCVEEIRGIMDLLGGHVVDDLGLMGAVERYCSMWKSPATDIQIRMTNQRLPMRTERHLYRVIQTSLGNVLRHARASHVSIVLSIDDAAAVLSVKDDGVGFDLASVQRNDGGYGLRSIEKRAHILGGRMTIRSRKGRGTVITITVPKLN